MKKITPLKVVASVGLSLLLLISSCWADGFKLPRMTTEQLQRFEPEEFMIVEVIIDDTIPGQIRGFADGKWRTPEEVAEIAQKRRSMSSLELQERRICPKCLKRFPNDYDFSQHLSSEIVTKLKAEGASDTRIGAAYALADYPKEAIPMFIDVLRRNLPSSPKNAHNKSIRKD